jgi:acetolactate synthase-1/2/3 large subunit
MRDLIGKVVFITGGASGRGLAMARVFGRAGMITVVADLRQDRIDESLHLLRGEGIDASGITLDVTDRAAYKIAADEVEAKVGPVQLYLGSMGVGFGTAIGAQLAGGPESRTILVTGDGAVGYSLAEFDTLVRQNVPLIVIVMNNQSWGATLHFQEYVVGPDRITNTRLENGRYHEVAEALGADGYYVDEPSASERAS